MNPLAPVVAEKLNGLDATALATNRDVQLLPRVTASRLDPTERPTIRVRSRDAGASSFGDTYLGALSVYLSGSPTIANKLEKLEREARRIDAKRGHLFIGAATTGRHAGLFPSSPSYFTWAEFTPPPLLDDLWIDGVDELYHWTREAGWFFHRTS